MTTELETNLSSQPAHETSHETHSALATKPKRFDLFVLDIGWKSSVSDVLRHNLDLLKRYQLVYNLYVLNEQQCIEMLRLHPSSIGNEPSLLVIDRDAYAVRRKSGFGFKYNMGVVRDASTANSILKWILAVLAEQRPGSDITEPIRTVMHKEGIRGAIDILADITRSPMGESATH